VSTSSSSQYLRKSSNSEKFNVKQIPIARKESNVQKNKQKKSNNQPVYNNPIIKDKKNKELETKKGQRISVVIPCITSTSTPTSRSSSDRNQRSLRFKDDPKDSDDVEGSTLYVYIDVHFLFKCVYI
jgi:hypothetical protein